MKNSLCIHKWTHNEFNIFILGVLTRPHKHHAIVSVVSIYQIFARNALRSYVYIIGEKLPDRLLFSEIQLQS